MNYLRVRGEYTHVLIHRINVTELPPRARRILEYRHHHGFDNGTTSACAENTARVSGNPAPSGNYLRVRGEYPVSSLWPPRLVELPPRARRILETLP